LIGDIVETNIEVVVDIPDWLTCLTLNELESIETIESGHTDDLKINDNSFKVWLCRCDTYDGMPYDNAVTIEKYIENRWVEVLMYEAN
jgi:hypothetical protein